jgi:uncharacterized protein (DUF488 family)
MIEKVVTIGAYGFNGRSFVEALLSAGVDLFIDVRARRGMRGHAYAFANASRLQAALADVGIRYTHAKELAPSETVRNAQRSADAADGVAKRDRSRLSDAFTTAYRAQCLSGFDSRRFVEVYCSKVRRPALFCVEREPCACHRSLVAERLAAELGVPVENLKP